LQISVFLKDDGPHWQSSWLAGALDPQCGVGPSGAQSAQCQQSPKRLDEKHRHGVNRFAGFAKQGSHQLDPFSHGHNDQQNQYLHTSSIKPKFQLKMVKSQKTNLNTEMIERVIA
jgi:hypothetical protein